MLTVANVSSCIDPQNRIGHPVLSRGKCSRNTNVPKHVLLLVWFCVPKLWIESELWFEGEKKRTFGITTCEMSNLEID